MEHHCNACELAHKLIGKSRGGHGHHPGGGHGTSRHPSLGEGGSGVQGPSLGGGGGRPWGLPGGGPSVGGGGNPRGRQDGRQGHELHSDDHGVHEDVDLAHGRGGGGGGRGPGGGGRGPSRGPSFGGGGGGGRPQGPVRGPSLGGGGRGPSRGPSFGGGGGGGRVPRAPRGPRPVGSTRILPHGRAPSTRSRDWRANRGGFRRDGRGQWSNPRNRWGAHAHGTWRPTRTWNSGYLGGRWGGERGRGYFGGPRWGYGLFGRRGLGYYRSPWSFITPGLTSALLFGWLWDATTGRYYNPYYLDYDLPPLTDWQLQAMYAALARQNQLDGLPYDAPPQARYLADGQVPRMTADQMAAMRAAAEAAYNLDQGEYDAQVGIVF